MVLDDINAALEGINGPVFYGTAAKLPKDDPWNYTVFSRTEAVMTAHLSSRSATFEVALVHEGYIPEESVKATIEAMAELPGMNLAQGSSIRYAYDVKPGTKVTVEMAVLTFNKASRVNRGAMR